MSAKAPPCSLRRPYLALHRPCQALHRPCQALHSSASLYRGDPGRGNGGTPGRGTPPQSLRHRRQGSGAGRGRAGRARASEGVNDRTAVRGRTVGRIAASFTRITSWGGPSPAPAVRRYGDYGVRCRLHGADEPSGSPGRPRPAHSPRVRCRYLSEWGEGQGPHYLRPTHAWGLSVAHTEIAAAGRPTASALEPRYGRGQPCTSGAPDAPCYTAEAQCLNATEIRFRFSSMPVEGSYS